jgi:hypothetical protein
LKAKDQVERDKINARILFNTIRNEIEIITGKKVELDWKN